MDIGNLKKTAKQRRKIEARWIIRMCRGIIRKKRGIPYSVIESHLVRVARWFLFEPKNSNLGKFWRDSVDIF
jgi:hypothetical protein